MASEPAPGGGNQVDAIDAREGIGSGLSAEDRAQTIRLASSPAAAARDFVRPGHVLPLRAAPNGVLDRPRPTEAAVDLVKLCGEGEGAVLAPLLRSDREQGEGLGVEEMLEVTDDDVVAHRWRNERLLEVATTTSIPTPAGEFRVVGFQEKVSGDVHLAFVSGDLSRRQDVLVSAHVECLLGSSLGGGLCDCAARLEEAIVRAQQQGGILIFSQLPAAEKSRNPLTSCPAVYAATETAGDATDPPNELQVMQILKELKVESVRWLGSRPHRMEIPVSEFLTYAGRRAQRSSPPHQPGLTLKGG